jgi:hypothetical protein
MVTPRMLDFPELWWVLVKGDWVLHISKVTGFYIDQIHRID